MSETGKIEIKVSYRKLITVNSIFGVISTVIAGYYIYDLCKQLGAPQKFSMFFGAWCLLTIILAYGPTLWLFLTVRGPVITLSEQGVYDWRFSDTLIPWNAVQKLVCKGIPSLKFALLSVAPEVARYIPKKAIWSIACGSWLKQSSYRVTMMGLDGNEVEILALIEKYYAQYGQSGSAVPA